MSQSEVLEFLKKNKGKYFSANEIIEQANLDIEPNAIRNNLFRLRRTNWIKHTTLFHNPIRYRYNSRG